MSRLVELTETMLNIKDDDKRISRKEFKVINGKNTEYVLFLGKNPAGNEKDAERELNEDFLFLYYVPKLKNIANVNNNYFGAIYKLMVHTCGERNVKWDWCNLSEDELISKINVNKKLKANKDIILEFYKKHKDAKYTILTGDLFNYHMTDSKELKKLYKRANITRENVESVIDEYIKKIKSNFKFIYVNNAEASRIIGQSLMGKDDFQGSCIEYKNTTIFLGAMLSGQGAMDIYSRRRLIADLSKKVEIIPMKF